MRDQTKVVIGLGSIWGLLAFGVVLLNAFTLGANDTAPEIIAIVLYGLTILPSCILSIWFRRPAAIWLMALSPLTAIGSVYQILEQPSGYRPKFTSALFLVEVLVIAALPALIGYLLLRSDPD